MSFVTDPVLQLKLCVSPENAKNVIKRDETVERSDNLNDIFMFVSGKAKTTHPDLVIKWGVRIYLFLKILLLSYHSLCDSKDVLVITIK